MGPALREWHDHPEALFSVFPATFCLPGAASAGTTACQPILHLEATGMAPVLAITLYKHSATYTVMCTITDSQPQSITQSIHSHTHSQCHVVIYNRTLSQHRVHSHTVLLIVIHSFTLSHIQSHMLSHTHSDKGRQHWPPPRHQDARGSLSGH